MIFFGVLTCFAAIVTAYLWRRLVRDTRLPPRAARAASLLLAALALSVPATFVLRMASGTDVAPRPLTAAAFGWLGLSLYLLAWFLVWDLLRATRRAVLERRASAPEPEPETRRVFLARSIASGALLAGAGVGVFGVRSAVWDITTPEVPVALSRLPRALDGLSIALLSDVHIGPMLDGRFLRHLVDETTRLRPDMIAIVGDLVDGSVSRIGDQVAELRRLEARYGVYFVTGNHEYHSGAAHWVEFLRRLGIRVLMNERVAIGDAAHGGASFDLAGIPDRLAVHVSAIGPDIQQAVLGRDPERELVVLAHQPVQIRMTAPVGPGLQLSGHTHGGQLYPFGELARLSQPYIAGLHRHEPTPMQIYVSCGTGFWGPPLRVRAPAEVALLRLHSV